MSNVARWRLNWDPQGYACRDEHGGLLVVPPLETRRSLGYCGACPWVWGEAGCLFAPSYAPVVIAKPAKVDTRTREQRRAQSRAAMARRRAKGLASNNEPLKRNCWNCTQVRCADGSGKYVCVHAPGEAPVSVYAMRRRSDVAEQCEGFEWRLVVEIRELEVTGEHEG